MSENDCEIFRAYMKELEESTGKNLKDEGENDSWTIPYVQGAVNIHISLREKTGYVIVFSDVGSFGPSADREMRAAILLTINHLWKYLKGISFAVDGAESRVVLQDRFSVRRFASAEALAAYFSDVALFVGIIRRRLIELEDVNSVMVATSLEETEEASAARPPYRMETDQEGISTERVQESEAL